MKTIYKYPFNIVDTQTLDLPAGYEITHIGFDPAGPACIWALIDTEESLEEITLHIRGTGHTAPANYTKILGSIFDIPYVWHLFI